MANCLMLLCLCAGSVGAETSVEQPSWPLTPEAMWKMGNEELKSGEEFLACAVIDELAYGFDDPENRKPEWALALAEQLNLPKCLPAITIIADLKYGVGGTEPNEALYQHHLLKAAYFAYYQINHRGARAEESTPYSKSIALDEVPIEFAGGYETWARAMDLRDRVVGSFEGKDACEKLALALSYRDGIGVPQDTDLANLLMNKTYFSTNHQDVQFAVSQLDPEYLKQFGREGLEKRALVYAAINGHPKAARLHADTLLQDGDPASSLLYLDIARRSGNNEAARKFDMVRSEYGVALSDDDRGMASFLVDLYSKSACQNIYTDAD